MNKKQKKIDLILSYTIGKESREDGYFEGGVQDPSYSDEILLWVEEDEKFDFDKDAFVRTNKYQVNLCGTERSLFELGRYLIGLSQYETENNNYHDHFDEISSPDGKKPCNLIIHSHKRLS